MKHTLTIHAFWDEKAHVWCAESKDIPGLVTEAATAEDLIKNVSELVPDLLELNGKKGKNIPYRLLMERDFRSYTHH